MFSSFVSNGSGETLATVQTGRGQPEKANETQQSKIKRCLRRTTGNELGINQAVSECRPWACLLSAERTGSVLPSGAGWSDNKREREPRTWCTRLLFFQRRNKMAALIPRRSNALTWAPALVTQVFCSQAITCPMNARFSSPWAHLGQRVANQARQVSTAASARNGVG